MAVAAFWMTMATWVQVVIAGAATIVAGVGTYLVLRSLRYSREATEAAARSADAAVENNKLSRQIFIVEQRARLIIDAYQLISPITWDPYGGKRGFFDIAYRIVNTGNTEASGVTSTARALISDLSAIEQYNAIAKLVHDPSPMMASRITIAKGNHVIMEKGLTLDLTTVSDDVVHLSPVVLICVGYGILSGMERHTTGVIILLRSDPSILVAPKSGPIPIEKLRLDPWEIGGGPIID